MKRPDDDVLAKYVWRCHGNVMASWRLYTKENPNTPVVALPTWQKVCADPNVIRLVRQLRQRSVMTAYATFSFKARDAANKILKIMDSGTSDDAMQFTAAKYVLEYAREGVTIEDLRQQIEDLQRLVAPHIKSLDENTIFSDCYPGEENVSDSDLLQEIRDGSINNKQEPEEDQ